MSDRQLSVEYLAASEDDRVHVVSGAGRSVRTGRLRRFAGRTLEELIALAPPEPAGGLAAWCSCSEDRVGGVHDPDCPTCGGEGVPIGEDVP